VLEGDRQTDEVEAAGEQPPRDDGQVAPLLNAMTSG